VGAGPFSTILHYDQDSHQLQDGDVVLMDAAGSYSGYASDLTRTVPVNGRFTPRQREIYEIVLGAQNAALAAAKPGAMIGSRGANGLNEIAYNYINTHGKDLHGQPLGKYWVDGLGHIVGIDAHDPASYPVVLKPGMVFTIEPGIYLPEENLGVRIGSDFVVNADGTLTDLDAGLPRTADEIEATMRAK